MAAPTATTTTEPNLVISVTGTNVDAGNNDYTLNYNLARLRGGFSIVTGTLTNMTVTVLTANLDGTTVDITSELFGVSSLSSSSDYVCDINLPLKQIIVRAARSNATNAVNFTIFAPRR